MGTNITGIGNANAIGFKSRVTGGTYFPPELKDALVGVWSAYGKSNDSTDRNIIKNKIKDRGGDFVISNAAFKLNSGYGKYEEDFTSWDRIDASTAEISNDGSKIKCINTILNVQYLFNSINKDIPSFKVKISNFTKGNIAYYYRKEDGTEAFLRIEPSPLDKVLELPKSYNTVEGGTGSRGGFYSSNINIGVTIEQIPSYQGAFVTDGVDDLITSTKTVQEMLEGNNEITVVSMIGQLSTPNVNNYTNTIRNQPSTTGSYNKVEVSAIDKTGIYGYSFNSSLKCSIINDILGDKQDYSVSLTTQVENISAKYLVQGWIDINGLAVELSSVAWYWTIIANKVLTTDQINQVIAYFNLDRTLKPDILCNTIKQGITNENHAEFGDKLIDFSGNGRDIQLNNIAWKLDSGIGKYEVDFSTWSGSGIVIGNGVGFKIEKETISWWGMYAYGDTSGLGSFTIKVTNCHDPFVYRYKDEDGNWKNYLIESDGIYTLPASGAKDDKDNYRFFNSNPNATYNGLTVEQIPSHAGALCLDGINDFGKVTGMPIYKDYTFIIDYKRISYTSSERWVAGVVSKSHVANQGAFILMTANTEVEQLKQAYSFGGTTSINRDDFTRALLYQSKYKCGDVDLTVGEGVDSDTLWLGTFRDGDYRFFNGAIYSLMSFPYSMSEFLIERQLKKHKLGTLYPDMVEFRPVIKANANYKITYYQIDSTNTWKSIKVGDYIVIGAKLAFQITFDNDASELKEVVSPQLSGIIVEKRPSNPGYNIYSYITSKSPQKINITIDEYIRFEDIVQPYPVLLRFNDENGNEVSWGGKFRVGSTITRIGSAADSNLLPNIYNIFGLLLNDNQVTSSKVIVEKTMVFKAKSAYIFDNNEPKCILSPRLLRIPNSSYKILGYIPDISGHGNNGVIHNSAYAEGSGVNEDGSYQFDGVDDFVTIPTTVGGKQVLMKVNWQNKTGLLYDQRKNGSSIDAFAILNVNSNNSIAYNSRNTDGETYIDGILNKNIVCPQLYKITHSITIINQLANKEEVISPTIGSDTTHKIYFSQMSLYDFMLFDEISTDDKIKELNEYVGIEAKVELPPYYWDAYGKTNFDADRDSIQQRGVAVGNYDLTNYNHAYDKMSGYGGYAFAKFDNTTEWTTRNREDGIEIIKRNGYSFTAKRIGTGQYFYNFQNRSTTVLNKSLTVKAVSNNNTYIRWEYKYRTAEKPDVDSTLYLVIQAMTPNVPITVTLPYKTEQEKADLGVTEGSDSYLFYFDPSDIPVGDEYTVEMLPLYTNGLVYDGIADYSKNANIPALDDFTAIIKRQFLKKQGSPLIKGSKVYEGGNGNALLLEWDKAYNFVFYKRTDIMEGKLPDNISFITPTNYNGNVITRGSEQDTNGICIAGDGNAGFANMVFYKLILYPKTIPLLQINFLKNLMERDEIIDLTNPIFIKNE